MAKAEKRKSFPKPHNGQVIRYAYLWQDEQLRGRTEGRKDRPCAVILAVKSGPRVTVFVLPITHSRPKDLSLAMELPRQTKQRLGLDGERSWIVLSEANRFVWPGPDLRPALPGNPASVVYGALSAEFYNALRVRFIALLEAKRARIVGRL